VDILKIFWEENLAGAEITESEFDEIKDRVLEGEYDVYIVVSPKGLFLINRTKITSAKVRMVDNGISEDDSDEEL
jgi:predicted solute-binding protein